MTHSAKYSEAQFFTTLKNLSYFVDAENDPMPIMMNPTDWDDVKGTILSELEHYC